MYQYRRTVQYYETDKMGITHHANYIKWMEEARIGFLDSIGLPFQYRYVNITLRQVPTHYHSVYTVKRTLCHVKPYTVDRKSVV